MCYLNLFFFCWGEFWFEKRQRRSKKKGYKLKLNGSWLFNRILSRVFWVVIPLIFPKVKPNLPKRNPSGSLVVVVKTCGTWEKTRVFHKLKAWGLSRSFPTCCHSLQMEGEVVWGTFIYIYIRTCYGIYIYTYSQHLNDLLTALFSKNWLIKMGGQLLPKKGGQFGF